jgi:hypothetical protein
MAGASSPNHLQSISKSSWASLIISKIKLTYSRTVAHTTPSASKQKPEEWFNIILKTISIKFRPSGSPVNNSHEQSWVVKEDLHSNADPDAEFL